MNRQDVKWMLLAPTIAAIVMLLGEPLRAEVLEHTTKVAGTTVHYKTVLPDGYDPKKAYPAILAFGGGSQDMITVDNILNRNFRAEAEKRAALGSDLTAVDGADRCASLGFSALDFFCRRAINDAFPRLHTGGFQL